MIDIIPLAADFADHIIDGEFLKAFLGEYTNVMGLTVLGLFVWGAVSSSIFIRTGSFLLPFGLLMVIGGAALSQIASVGVTVAVLLVLVVPAGVTTALYIAYSR